jgi:hypothetical protein
MKKIFVAVAEFLFFLVLDIVGGVFYHPFHVQTLLQAARSFVWDGVLFMLIAFLLLLLIAAVRRRLASSVLPLAIALVLAGLAGFLLKVGFVTHNW